MTGKRFLPLALCAVAACSADEPVAPLDLKPGLWETTLTVRTTGMPPMPPEVASKLTPEQRSMIDAKAKARAAAGPKTTVTKKCFAENDLSEAWLLTFGSDRQGCKQTTARPSRQIREIRLECGQSAVHSNGMIRVEEKSPEVFKVTSQWFTTDGSRKLTIASTADGKWLGASCDTKEEPPPSTASPTADYYAKLGREQIQQNNFREALSNLNRAIALDPKRATSFNARGYANLRLGDLTTAIADFSEAIRLRPDYSNAYRNRAVARRRAGDPAGAAEDDRKAAEFSTSAPTKM